MKKYLRFLFLGFLFGLILTKTEIISWFRIQEMFRFQSIHMYGFIGIAVGLATLGNLLIKKYNIKNSDGEEIHLIPIDLTPGNFIGGVFFGMGWALIGACPGPMFALLGGGYPMILFALLGGLLGTMTYGLIGEKLPK